MKTIVIADDDRSFLAGLAEVLKMSDASYDVFIAENGKQAERILNSASVDLLITDLRMPLLNGVELIRNAVQSNPDLPVIIVSAGADNSVLREFNRNNYYYFDKPVPVGELVSTVRKLLDHTQNKSRSDIV